VPAATGKTAVLDHRTGVVAAIRFGRAAWWGYSTGSWILDLFQPISALMAKQGPRKKLPKELAVINADNCTGCESCLEVCPVDCIIKVQQYDQFHNLQSWCQIDIERCVGCEVCVHIPGKKTNPYDLKVCPWDAIEMVPTEEVAIAVSQMGGPPEYVEANWDRLVDTAQHLAELKAGS